MSKLWVQYDAMNQQTRPYPDVRNYTQGFFYSLYRGCFGLMSDVVEEDVVIYPMKNILRIILQPIESSTLEINSMTEGCLIPRNWLFQKKSLFRKRLFFWQKTAKTHLIPEKKKQKMAFVFFEKNDFFGAFSTRKKSSEKSMTFFMKNKSHCSIFLFFCKTILLYGKAYHTAHPTYGLTLFTLRRQLNLRRNN